MSSCVYLRLTSSFLSIFALFFVLFSTTWTSEDCRHADGLRVNEVTATTTAVLVPQPKAARRVEGRAETRPSDSLGWPEGAKAIREGPEFHSCFSEKSFDITADGTKQQLQVQTPRH